MSSINTGAAAANPVPGTDPRQVNGKPVTAAAAAQAAATAQAAVTPDIYAPSPVSAAAKKLRLPAPMPVGSRAPTAAQVAMRDALMGDVHGILAQHGAGTAPIALLPKNMPSIKSEADLAKLLHILPAQVNKLAINLSNDDVALSFMKLALQSKSFGVNTINALLQALGNSRDMYQKAEINQEKEYMKKAEHAQKKAGVKGVLNKVFAVFILIATCLLTALTMGAFAAAIVIGATLVAFLAAGLAKGKGHGGFDLEYASNIATMVGGALDFAGIAVAMAGRTALKLSEKGLAKVISKEAASKTATKTGPDGKTVLEADTKAKAPEGAANAEKEAEQSSDKTEETFAERRLKLLREKAKRPLPTSVADQIARIAAPLTGKPIISGIGKNSLIAATVLSNLGMQVGKIGVSTATGLAQNEADAASAKAKLTDVYVKLYQNTYDQTSDLLQLIFTQHQSAANEVLNKLNRDFATNQAINQAIGQTR